MTDRTKPGVAFWTTVALLRGPSGDPILEIGHASATYVSTQERLAENIAADPENW